MVSKRLVQDLQYIFDTVEEKICNKNEKILLEMYWQIGYCLKDYTLQEIYPLVKELSVLVGAEEQLLIDAYFFYKDVPLKKNIQVVSA